MANYNLTSFRNTYILTDQTGSLFDSGGPTGSYSSGQNYYVLIAPENTTGSLTLNVVSGVIDASDALRIYNGIPNTSSYSGLNLNGTLLAVLSGTLSPQTITASSGRAYIRFGSRTSTNTIGTLAGFQLDWTGSGIQTVDSASGVIRNKYAATFPLDSYLTFAPGMFTGSSTLTGSKDIVLGFWARADYDASDPTRGIITIGDSNTVGLSVYKVSAAQDLRLSYRDTNGNVNSTTFSNMLQGGGTGAPDALKLVPQWHHYGFVVRRTSTTGYNVAGYRDGAFFSSASATFVSVHGNITSSQNIVLGQYRAGIISAGQSWSGSLDDVFLGTLDSAIPVSHSSFFSTIYNSGNWSDPTEKITGSYYSGKNGAVIFNWRFEETGSMLNTKDWGTYGNIHSASTLVTSSAGSVFLTATSSGMSYTPYGSLAYSASMLSNAVISFNTSSASVYENTASYIFNVQVATASFGQSATASITTSSFGQTAVLGTNYLLINSGTTISSSAQLPFYLSWSAGDTTTKYITASIIDNTTYAGSSSSFSLTIQTASSTNITAGSPSFFTLSILDYEEGYASLQRSSYSTGESSGSVIVYVDRLSGSNGPLSVNYSTTNGTALSGTNYTKTTGTLSWTDGTITSQTISIPISYDNVQTSDLNFTINLFGLSTGSYSSYPTAITSSIITIADQEPGTFNWEVASLSTYETSSSTTINVLRTSGSYGVVTASLFYSSSAGTISPQTGSAGTVIFSSSQTTAQVVFPITDDLVDEVNDPVYVTFSSFTSTAGTAKTGSQGTLILTIIDNETGSITFSGSSATIYENTGSYYIAVNRLYGGDQAETASITIGGTAISGTQYDIIYNGITQSSPFNIIWADQTKDTRYITASIYDNNLLDGNRNIIFGINSSSVSAIGPTSSFQLNILDYEITGSVRFITNSYAVSIPGTVNVQVERYDGQDVSASAIIDVSSSSTAVAGVDYANIFPYTVNWANQESGSKNIAISTLSSWGPSSTLNLKFTSLTNLSSGSILTASVAITSTTITQSTSIYSNLNKDYTINDYANLSYQFTRRTQQVPFSLNLKGTGKIRKP